MDSETPGSNSGGGSGRGVNSSGTRAGARPSSSSMLHYSHHSNSFHGFRIIGSDSGANSTATILENLLMDSAAQIQRQKVV